MKLIERFLSNDTAVVNALLNQKSIPNQDIAEDVAKVGEVVSYQSGEYIIKQGDYDQDVYYILAGKVELHINGVVLPYERGEDVSVGELSAINASQARTASLLVTSETVALKIKPEDFQSILRKHPEVSIFLLKDVSSRLAQRNDLINKCNERPKLFIISTVEALEVARQIKSDFNHDPIDVTIWNAAFAPGAYTLEALEQAVKESDFGLAIMQGDDLTTSRGIDYSAPRDNVIFELGLFMGHLSRSRTLIAVPQGGKVKLASDLQGLTILDYKVEQDQKVDVINLATALRNHIKTLGPKKIVLTH
jgi:CRP/FNR family cyclic AMP-dependent transcriptional regulator